MEIAGEWSSIGLELRDIGIYGLAKRCDLKGRYWVNPQKFSNEFWEAADIGVTRMEELARTIRASIEKNGLPPKKEPKR